MVISNYDRMGNIAIISIITIIYPIIGFSTSHIKKIPEKNCGITAIYRANQHWWSLPSRLCPIDFCHRLRPKVLCSFESHLSGYWDLSELASTWVIKCPHWTSPNRYIWSIMATFSGDVQYSQNGTVTNPCSTLITFGTRFSPFLLLVLLDQWLAALARQNAPAQP